MCRGGVGTHGGKEYEAVCLRSLGGARKRQHIVEIDPPEGPIGACRPARAADTAKSGVALHALQLALKFVELNDAVGKSRMLPLQRPPGHGKAPGEIRGL